MFNTEGTPAPSAPTKMEQRNHLHTSKDIKSSLYADDTPVLGEARDFDKAVASVRSVREEFEERNNDDKKSSYGLVKVGVTKSRCSVESKVAC